MASLSLSFSLLKSGYKKLSLKKILRPYKSFAYIDFMRQLYFPGLSILSQLIQESILRVEKCVDMSVT